jgi:hypothetical protein
MGGRLRLLLGKRGPNLEQTTADGVGGGQCSRCSDIRGVDDESEASWCCCELVAHDHCADHSAKLAEMVHHLIILDLESQSSHKQLARVHCAGIKGL